MPTTFRYPPKPSPGDTVAVLSPSSGLPAVFPMPFDLGLSRLRDEFGLVPVEYPTTRVMGAAPAERARDLHAAVADPAIKAIITSIGGDDQLKVLAHLDRDLISAHPKPFFGYSDNTNLHLFLRGLGIVSYHGGAVMVQFGRPGAMDPLSRESLRRALFTSGSYVLEEATDYADEEGDWADAATFRAPPRTLPAPPWSWHGPRVSVTGPAWGGNLVLETSEELPSSAYVYRVLMCMGERGLLRRFAAIVWARPKAWALDQRASSAEKARYVASQRDAVLAAVAEYHPQAPVVFGVDFGHTEPQHVIPSGGTVTVDSGNQRISVIY